MSTKSQRVTSLALAFMLAIPLSLFAENRSRGRTDLEQLAAELERVFGAGSARVEGRRESAARETGGTPELRQIVNDMNRERARHGLHPLRLEARLTRAAEDRAGDMFAKRYFDHVSPDGIQPFTWVRKRGYRYSIVGENLALGYRSSGAVVGGWMRSPGHRENILTAGFDEVGIAISNGSPTRGYRGPLIVALYAAR